MDVSTSLAQVEAAMAHQTALAAGDPSLEAAAESLLAALRPALRQLALDIAEQAAQEVAAQLPDHEVDIVLREGEPAIRIQPRGLEEPASAIDAEARVTLRLPEDLKHLVEEEAAGIGDSVNAWIVKALSTRLRAGRSAAGGRHASGEFET